MVLHNGRQTQWTSAVVTFSSNHRWLRGGFWRTASKGFRQNGDKSQLRQIQENPPVNGVFVYKSLASKKAWDHDCPNDEFANDMIYLIADEKLLTVVVNDKDYSQTSRILKYIESYLRKAEAAIKALTDSQNSTALAEAS